MRVLDEVADAVRRARGRRRPPVLVSVKLDGLFDPPLSPREWAVVKRCLACELPPLRFDQGHFFLPDGLATVWDLADLAARAHPGWEPPRDRTTAAWREAQIFAGVRLALVESLAIDPGQVTRGTRLIDLV